MNLSKLQLIHIDNYTGLNSDLKNDVIREIIGSDALKKLVHNLVKPVIVEEINKSKLQLMAHFAEHVDKLAEDIRIKIKTIEQSISELGLETEVKLTRVENVLENANRGTESFMKSVENGSSKLAMHDNLLVENRNERIECKREGKPSKSIEVQKISTANESNPKKLFSMPKDKTTQISKNHFKKVKISTSLPKEIPNIPKLEELLELPQSKHGSDNETSKKRENPEGSSEIMFNEYRNVIIKNGSEIESLDSRRRDDPLEEQLQSSSRHETQRSKGFNTDREAYSKPSYVGGVTLEIPPLSTRKMEKA